MSGGLPFGQIKNRSGRSQDSNALPGYFRRHVNNPTRRLSRPDHVLDRGDRFGAIPVVRVGELAGLTVTSMRHANCSSGLIAGKIPLTGSAKL